MNCADRVGVAVFLGSMIGILIGLGIGVSSNAGDLKDEAIKRGLALYCPTTGDWAWKGECEQ